MAIFDNFGRNHDYLRISLTDRCNFRCVYCMPFENMQFMPSGHLMTADEILDIAGIFVDMGVNKIRLTGGEPLMRKDAAEIILRLSKLPIKLTLTTNGYFLHRYFDTFKESGIKSINISLDTLDAEKFKKITQRDYFGPTMKNIQQAIELGYHLKINAVVIKGINDDELARFAEWSKNDPVHIRFIEFMPFHDNQWDRSHTISYQEMLDIIGKSHPFEKIADAKNDTAKNFRVENALGTFAVISSITNPFCDTCNRIRLTADGKLKNCLFSSDELDILSAYRNQIDIQPLIHSHFEKKHAARAGKIDFNEPGAFETYNENRSMISIGG